MANAAMFWGAAAYNYEQRVAIVNITPAQFKVIPTYTATTLSLSGSPFQTASKSWSRVRTWRGCLMKCWSRSNSVAVSVR